MENSCNSSGDTAKLRVAPSRPTLIGTIWFRVHSWLRVIGYLIGFRTKDERDFLFLFARSRRDVFVLQIGANDGITRDPLYPFIFHYRWRALLVEPVLDVFAKLTLTYKDNTKVSLLNAAQGEHDGVAIIYRVQPDDDVPAWCQRLASFSKRTVMYHRYKYPDIGKHLVEEEVNVITFQSMVKKYGILSIDIVVIDTEGYDCEIIKQLDLDSFIPQIIIYEHIHLDLNAKAVAEGIMQLHGYCLYETRDNTVAVKRKAPPVQARAVSYFEREESICDKSRYAEE